MQCRALIAVFLLAAVSHAEEAPASLPDMDIGATVLGLQRTMTLVRAKVPLEEDSVPNLHITTPSTRGDAEKKDEENTPRSTARPMTQMQQAIRIPYTAGSLLGLQRSVKLTRTEAPLEEDEEENDSKIDTPNDEPQLADVSVLGLQRSMKLSRTEAPLEEQEEQEKADARATDVAPRAADASILGLQRSVKLGRTEAPMEDEEQEHDEEALQLADTSVLGLQRSVKLSRIEAPLDEEDLFDDDELQLADVSVLGLQRSVKVISRNKAAPVVEDDLHESVLEV